VTLATSRDRAYALAFCITVGLVLTFGFLPAVGGLFDWIWYHVNPSYSFNQARSPLRMSLFPALAALMYWSLRREINPPEVAVSRGTLWRISLLPWLIAAGFGFWFNRLPQLDVEWVWWQMVLAPIGEEFLFRGWLYDLSDRLFKKKMFTATNTFPVALWTTSIAFSLWHLQNHLPGSAAGSSATLNFTMFQMGYTLVAGFWLGYLRWKSDSVVFPILAHVVLNALGGSLWLYIS
jgi:membrane protease YdiL (CAAX protease family)